MYNISNVYKSFTVLAMLSRVSHTIRMIALVMWGLLDPILLASLYRIFLACLRLSLCWNLFGKIQGWIYPLFSVFYAVLVFANNTTIRFSWYNIMFFTSLQIIVGYHMWRSASRIWFLVEWQEIMLLKHSFTVVIRRLFEAKREIYLL